MCRGEAKTKPAPNPEALSTRTTLPTAWSYTGPNQGVSALGGAAAAARGGGAATATGGGAATSARAKPRDATSAELAASPRTHPRALIRPSLSGNAPRGSLVDDHRRAFAHVVARRHR